MRPISVPNGAAGQDHRLPAMQPFLVAPNAHRNAEQIAELGLGKEGLPRAVAENAAIAHQDDAVDFGKDISKVVRDQNDSRAFLRQPAQRLAKAALRRQIEGVGWLVQKQLARPVNERARNEDAPLLSGRHLAHQLRGKMEGIHALQSLSGAVAHIVGNFKIGPKGGSREEAGDHGIESRCPRRSLSGQFVAEDTAGHHAEVAAKRGQIPAFAPKDAYIHSRLHDGIDLAGDGKDEGRFATAIGAEDGDVLTCSDAQVDIVEHHRLSTRHVYIVQFDKALSIDAGSKVCERCTTVIHPPYRLSDAAARTAAMLMAVTTNLGARHLLKLDGTIKMTPMADASRFLLPRGFRFGAACAGLKQSGRADFALIVADRPASAAAAFTANKVTAAPLMVDKEHLRATANKVRVVAINAGNANCAAGQAGIDAARSVCADAARLFGCAAEEVFPSSTGIIGVPLPAEKISAVLPGLAGSLGSELDHFQQVAQAILTTDTVDKTAFARYQAGEHEVRIAALCKGAGMIHPQLVPHATMLVYILTDAAAEPEVLDGYLRRSVELSFNRISIDGDTSTNDTVLMLASGTSGATLTAGDAEFAAALNHVCTSLARQIVADGEGATHVAELRIEGAADDTDALRVAKAIAHSPLVKTAWAGSDPNWGRIAAAIGYSGAQVDPDTIDISFGELAVCRNGGRAAEFDEAAAHAYIAQPEFIVTIQLHQGPGKCVFWTTDLTVEYVHINADYST